MLSEVTAGAADLSSKLGGYFVTWNTWPDFVVVKALRLSLYFLAIFWVLLLVLDDFI